jgi:hypothetical protein
MTSADAPAAGARAGGRARGRAGSAHPLVRPAFVYRLLIFPLMLLMLGTAEYLGKPLDRDRATALFGRFRPPDARAT